MALMAALMFAVAVSACGSSDSQPEISSAPDNLLKPAQISEYPQGSVEQAFLEFWSSLQFQSWAEAASYYHPEFRDFVGTASVIGAKKLNGSTYPLLKPVIARVGEHDGETTIFYALRLPDGSKELNSITWRRNDGSWQIIYDSRLDPELHQFAQNQVELEENGSLSTDPSEGPSAQAAKAGINAANLQAEFRARELDPAS